MDEQKTIDPDKAGWDEAIADSYVKLEKEKEKKLVITDWGFVKKKNNFKVKDTDPEEVIDFIATVVEEDGAEVEKIFTASSTRLKKKLREVLEGVDTSEKVAISVMKIGEGFKTAYVVTKKEDE